ncbi:hypothetical protein HY061_02960 [Candidatus Azambacteria bacterium]|nr:hypothetical protein [Candidatus Azambacteria bacterium]
MRNRRNYREGVDNPDKSCTSWNYEDGSGIKVESTDLRFDGDRVIQTNIITLGTDGKLTNHQILRFVGGATSDMVGAGKKFGDDTFISKCRIYAMNLHPKFRRHFHGLYGIPIVDSDHPEK